MFAYQAYFDPGRLPAGRVGTAGRLVDGVAAVGLAGAAPGAGGRVAGVVGVADGGGVMARAILANSASRLAA